MGRLLSRNPRDLWAGAIYVAFGGTALVTARRYPFGTGSEMGPGYVPTLLGAILVLIGGAAIVRSFLRDGEEIGTIAWRPLALVLGGTVAFALLLPVLGLAVALPAVALLGAAASRRFGWNGRAALGLLALTAICVGVFVLALGVPMPLVGSWLSKL